MQIWTPHDVSWKGSEHYQCHHSPNTEGEQTYIYVNCDIAKSSLVVIVYTSDLQITNPDNALIQSDEQRKVRESACVELYTSTETRPTELGSL